MSIENVIASRGFISELQEVSFFVTNDKKKGAILEIEIIDKERMKPPVAFNIPLSKETLKELSIMFEMASQEEYKETPRSLKTLDNFRKQI